MTPQGEFTTMSMQFNCPQNDCQFAMRSESEYEIFDGVFDHMNAVHDTTLSGTEIQDNIVEREYESE